MMLARMWMEMRRWMRNEEGDDYDVDDKDVELAVLSLSFNFKCRQ